MTNSLLSPSTLPFDLPDYANLSDADFREAIESVVGFDNLAEAQQSGGGEDFAWYLEHVPGAMARLGVWDAVSPTQDLHRPGFTLDEGAMIHGVRTLVALARGGRKPRAVSTSEEGD